MSKKVKYPLLSLQVSFTIVSMACTIFVVIKSPTEMGLYLLFLLPLAFTIVCFISKKELIFARDSFGLILLYSLLILRYLVTPFLIVQSGELVTSLSLTTETVYFAIITMILELFTIVISINLIWRQVQPTKVASTTMLRGTRLSWLGALIILLLLGIVLLRGTLPNVMEHLTFGANFQYSITDLKTYDMSVVLSVKTMLFLLVVSWFSNKYHKTKQILKKRIYFFFAISTALLNSIIYDANARMIMVIDAMASLTVLIYYFGDRIKKYLPIIAVIGFLFVWFLFSGSTLGVKSEHTLSEMQGYVGDLSQFISIGDLSRVAELYSNGISTVAHSYNMYDSITSKMTVWSYISELIKSINIFSLPGFWIVGDWFENIPSIQKLFNDTLAGEAYILPNAGLAMYIGTKYFGILIDIVFHYLIIYSIFSFHKRKEMSNDVSKKYLYSYCEMICAFILINNFMIAINVMTAMPFLFYILILLNNLGHKIKIRRVTTFTN